MTTARGCQSYSTSKSRASIFKIQACVLRGHCDDDEDDNPDEESQSQSKERVVRRTNLAKTEEIVL